MVTEGSSQNENSAGRTLGRAIDLLEVLLSASTPLALGEIGSRVNLHPSTTHRLLSTLVKRKFVFQDSSTKLYSLGPKLSFPSKAQAVIVNYQNIATPILSELSRNTGEAASMAIKSGNQAMYIAQATVGRLVNMFVQIGALVPMYCTGVGKVILSHLPSHEVTSIVENEGFTQITPSTIMNFQQLSQELAGIRANGYAIDNEEREIGIRCIAAPVISAEGKLISAISISGPAGRISPDKDAEFARIVCATASKISQRLS